METKKLKDGESTGWIKVLKKPKPKLQTRINIKPRSDSLIESQSTTLVVDSQLSNIVTVEPQTNADNTTELQATIQPRQRLNKPKPKLPLKQSSLSQFFQLENKNEKNKQLNIAKEVGTSRQSPILKSPAKKKSYRKKKDAQEETIGKNIKQDLPNSASVDDSIALDANPLGLGMSQGCYNNSPGELNGANPKRGYLASKKRIVGSDISYCQNHDDQQMPLCDSYNLSSFSMLTDDSFITTSSRSSIDITSDKRLRKSSKHTTSCGGNTHNNKEFENISSVHISNSSLQSNMKPLLTMNNELSVSVQNNSSLVVTTKSMSRKILSKDKNYENDNAYLGTSVDNSNGFDIGIQEYKENLVILDDDDDDDLWFNAYGDTTNTNSGTCAKIIHESQRSRKTKTLDASTQEVLCRSSISPVSSPPLLFSQSQISDEMDHWNMPKEILRSRTPDILSIQERLIKSGISPAPSPPSLLSQSALEQLSLSSLEQMPSLNISTLQFDDYDDMLL